MCQGQQTGPGAILTGGGASEPIHGPISYTRCALSDLQANCSFLQPDKSILIRLRKFGILNSDQSYLPKYRGTRGGIPKPRNWDTNCGIHLENIKELPREAPNCSFNFHNESIITEANSCSPIISNHELILYRNAWWWCSNYI